MSPALTEAAAVRRARVLLVLAATLGTLAGVVVTRSGDALGSARPGVDAIARVGERDIPKREYLRALEIVTSGRRTPRDEDASRVLEKLIDEELLVQHALATGLLASERGARDAVLRAMVDLAVADESSRAPSEENPSASQLGTQASDAAGDAPAGSGRASADPALEAVSEARARERALRTYLDELRARARIERAPEKTP